MNDSYDPDGLSEFAPELGVEKPTRAKTRASADVREPAQIGTEENRDDWLSAFNGEARSDAAPHPRVDAFGSTDDELDQFAPDEHRQHASDDEEIFLDQFAEQAPVRPEIPTVVLPTVPAHVRSQPWAGPWAAAAVAIVISVLLGTRSLHPAWWNAGRPDAGSAKTSEGQNALQFSTPGVEQGIPSQALRQFESVPVRVPHLATANARPSPSPSANAAPVVARRSVPREPVAVAPRTDRVAPRIDRAPAVDAVPLLPESVRTPLRLNTTLAPLTLPTESESAVQEYAVRRALTSYEKAYEGLDVAATAAVWPSVDRRALARAFDTLKFQGLNFKNCAITVVESSATARCNGTLQIIRKVGNSVPLTAEQEWVFKMRRLGADWKIEEVAASQGPGQVPQRTPSQG
jgi:hypothetical protein